MDKCLIYLIYCYTVCFYMTCSGLPRRIQFIRKRVGLHSALDSNTIEVSTAPSLMSCGRLGFEKNCTSFLYESTNNECTMYSVYMTGNGQIMNNYYVNIGAVENFNEPTMLTVPEPEEPITKACNEEAECGYGAGSSNPNFMLANGTGCTTYCQCISTNRWQEIPCGAGTLWNQDLKTCDHAALVECTV